MSDSAREGRAGTLGFDIDRLTLFFSRRTAIYKTPLIISNGRRQWYTGKSVYNGTDPNNHMELPAPEPAIAALLSCATKAKIGHFCSANRRYPWQGSPNLRSEFTCATAGKSGG